MLDENLEREGELLNKDLTKLNKFDPRMLELCQQLGRRIANKDLDVINWLKLIKLIFKKEMKILNMVSSC